ncbi:MAG TPA: phosphatase PAP2 family protein [Pseudolabrys sp.]|jgi:undecaprenyl-diphosphatase|nr:phosphatase PAP2 family protein [Pseudolabrys sp.]
MSMVNRFNRIEGEATLRRCASNIITSLTLLARPARLHAKPSWLRKPRDLVIAAVGTIVIFLILMTTIDAAAIRGVGTLPFWIPSLFDDLTEYGKSGWFLWPLGLLFATLSALPPILTPFSQRVLAAAMVRVGFLFAAIAVPSLFVTIIKRMIGRARPMVGGSLDPSLFRPFIWRVEYAGMPSGHATTAFAVLVAFGTLWPRARTILLIYALLIAISRVVVTAHYPSDVLFGALVGIAGAIMVRYYFAQRRLGFSIESDGTIHQYPGPSLRRIKAVARALLAP